MPHHLTIQHRSTQQLTSETIDTTADNLLYAGVAQSTITPPIGFDISGPEFSDRPAQSIDHDLYARSIVLKSYGETVAIVSLDVWSIADWLKRRLTQAIADASGIPQQNVIILSTGNGASPPLWRRETDLPTRYRNYIAYLPDIVAGTALEAALSLQPAAIGTISTTFPNLSCFTKPNQPENLETERETLQLTVIQSSDDSIACLLYNLACPATIVGNTQSWTADFPGVASSALENAGIDNAIFIQGASADVKPFDWWDGNPSISHAERSPADAQAFGILIATQAIRSAPNAITRRNAQIKTTTSEDGNIATLRIGDTTLISLDHSQPIEFSANLRSSLPDTKLLISTNPSIAEPASANQHDDTLAKAVELANQSGIYP